MLLPICKIITGLTPDYFFAKKELVLDIEHLCPFDYGHFSLKSKT